MDLDSFMGQAWADHARQAEAVATRVEEQGLALVLATAPGDGAQDKAVARLAQLAHHVHGAHLGQWQRGLRLQEVLIGLPACSAGTVTQLRRHITSLALAGGEPGARAALAPAERATVAALAADGLAGHDAARAMALLRMAIAEAEQLGLADDAPAVRVIAVAANNAAATLRELGTRSAGQTAAMLEAAAVARRFWERAGTWLQVERAEYYLTLSHLAAGDAATAREHALACLRTVADNGNVPLEVFFGQEALALAAQAAGDTATRSAAVAHAAETFPLIEESDRGWCQPTLDKLLALQASRAGMGPRSSP